MDRRTLVAVVLCLVIYYTWYGILRPPVPLDTDIPAVAEAPTPTAPAPVAPAPVVEIEERPFDRCGASGTLSSAGGVVRGLVLQDAEAHYAVTPLYWYVWGRLTRTLEGPFRPYDEPGPAPVLSEHAEALVAGFGTSSTGAYALRELEDGTLELLAPAGPEGIEVKKVLRPGGGGAACAFDLEVSFTNRGPTRFEGPLWIGMFDVFSASKGSYDQASTPAAQVDGSAETFTKWKKLDAGPVERPGHVDWFAVADRYFGMFLVPSAEAQGSLAFGRRPTADPEQPAYGTQYTLARSLDSGATYSERFRVYIGTLEQEKLSAVDPTLAGAVQYGWFSLFANPLLWLLKIYHAGTGNWGVAIILLTFTVKLVFFPLTQTAFKSSQAMAALQPKMQEIRETYKDKPEEMNRRTMDLFKAHGVNPLGGCLPMILQMPVWFALYRVLLQSVELYHTEFWYLKDLSSMDPYLLLPTLGMGLMVLQQQMMPMGNMDPAQQRIMKLMPLIFGFFFYVMPSGLVLYIFVNMVLSILQQWLIKRTYRPPEPTPAPA